MTDPDYDAIRDTLQAELDHVTQKVELLREQGTVPDNPTADAVANELLMEAYIDGLEARIDSLEVAINNVEREMED